MNIDPTASTLKNKGTPKAFHKNWYLKLNDPLTQRALWLRFTLLSSGNGFKRIAETWAVFFQKSPNREIKKIALKQTYDIKAFSSPEKADIRIGDCELLEKSTKGIIQSKGSSIEWDLSFIAGR